MCHEVQKENQGNLEYFVIQQTTNQHAKLQYFMNTQDNSNIHNSLSRISFKDDQVNDLMNSIENKLSMLACEDSMGSFEPSKIQSPKRELLTDMNSKRNPKITVHDLQSSMRKQNSEQLGQSRIVSRINQIEHFYMDKIQQMSNSIAHLEFEVQNINKINADLKKQNHQLHLSLAKNQRQSKQAVNRKLDQLKADLISKFSREAETHFEEHIKEMKSITYQLSEEKGKRKYLQQEVALLRSQKNNLEDFYKNLLENHKNLIKLDIEKSQKQPKSQIVTRQFIATKNEAYSNVGGKRSKRKQKGGSSGKKSEELSNQEMIPFLAKGIQDLKDKLKIK